MARSGWTLSGRAALAQHLAELFHSNSLQQIPAHQRRDLNDQRWLVRDPLTPEAQRREDGCGRAISVATTIHSDEALLAVGFIFTVDFFNTQFRPEKFPIDTVVFTAGLPLEEFKRDRPREDQQLLESGDLEQRLMSPPAPLAVKLWKRLGFIARGVGLLLILLILYAEIFAYR